MTLRLLQVEVLIYKGKEEAFKDYIHLQVRPHWQSPAGPLKVGV